MSEPQPTEHGTLLPDQAARIDAVCERFKAAYKFGDRPQLEDFLGEVAEAERRYLLHELVALEIKVPRLGQAVGRREGLSERG